MTTTPIPDLSGDGAIFRAMCDVAWWTHRQVMLSIRGTHVPWTCVSVGSWGGQEFNVDGEPDRARLLKWAETLRERRAPTEPEEPVKAKDGTGTRALQEEFDLFEHPWPKLCGTDREKWVAIAAMIDRAAHYEHHRDCGAFDGRRVLAGPPMIGDHAENHRQRLRMALVAFISAGIPRWITEEVTP